MIQLSLIAAIDEHGGIGYKGQLLYRLPSDLKMFKTLTTGGIVLMGRKTADSLKSPLKDRINLVLSHQPYNRVGFVGINCVQAALELFPNQRIWCIGGEQIYEVCLPMADQLVLTVIKGTPKKADAFFPFVDWSQFQRSPYATGGNAQDERQFDTFIYRRLEGTK